jgi:hypothetical protein
MPTRSSRFVKSNALPMGALVAATTVARIRREHVVKGKMIKEIARTLGVFGTRFARLLRSGEMSFA